MNQMNVKVSFYLKKSEEDADSTMNLYSKRIAHICGINRKLVFHMATSVLHPLYLYYFFYNK